LTPKASYLSSSQLQPSSVMVPLSGNVVPALLNGKATLRGQLDGSMILNTELVFAIQNPSSFQQCLNSIDDPVSPNSEHFLNSTTLQPYIPTPGEKESVVSYIKQKGFTVSDGDSPIVIKLTATVALIEKTFGLNINLYHSESNFTFYGPASNPTVPENFVSLISDISGLDNYSEPQPYESPCGLFALYPDCPQGVQVGYSLTSLFSSGYNGAGEEVAIVDEPGDQNIQTAINTYDSQYGLPSITLNIQYPDGVPTSYDPSWASESAMDVEAVHSVAPGAGIFLLYDTGPLLDAIDYIASNHLASIVSNSWGNGVDTTLSSAYVTQSDERLAIDASEGLTILFSSGDGGASPGGILGTEFPASDPNVLSVGATNLNLAGCGISTCSGYGTESGASISGGGYSGYFDEPYWQTDTIGSLSGRGVPDVSMFGYSPNYWVYSTYSNECGTKSTPTSGWFGCAGTSLSSPLWAGVLADALQVRGGGSFGNIDPLIYELGAGASYSSIFHDITSGSNGYSTGIGWDPVTGWGSLVANELAFS